MHRSSLILAGLLAVAPYTACAQSISSDELARQWRQAKLAELTAERSRIDAQMAVLATATPDAAPVQRITLTPVAYRLPAADAFAPTIATVQDTATVDDDTDDGSDDNGPRRSFGGIDLGVGLSFTSDIGKLDRVGAASVVNGIVRVDDQNNGRARIMLESHYFFTPCFRWLFGLRNKCTTDEAGITRAIPKETRWGMGPFVAVQPGSEEIIDAIGMGLMVGARRADSGQSFNLGVGIVVDPNTRVLGDGIRANQPLPVGETEVRYRETMQTGILVITSFSF